MINWPNMLKLCSQRIRQKFLEIFRSADADIAFGVGAGGDITKKIDLVAEKALIKTLQEHDASCTLISEEIGVRKIGLQPSNFFLTVDPVDGTVNATRGLPFFATSIAGSKKPTLQDIEVALVTDLFNGKTYTAERGCGAQRDGEKITPSSTSLLEEAVIGINFSSFKLRKFAKPLMAVMGEVGHVRHLGANALEICYVADGTIDGFIDLRGKLRITDIAAAFLIVHEAGGLMVTPEGTELNAALSPTQRVSFIAASNNSIYEKIKNFMPLAY